MQEAVTAQMAAEAEAGTMLRQTAALAVRTMCGQEPALAAEAEAEHVLPTRVRQATMVEVVVVVVRRTERMSRRPEHRASLSSRIHQAAAARRPSCSHPAQAGPYPPTGTIQTTPCMLSEAEAEAATRRNLPETMAGVAEVAEATQARRT
jgi:hypothetical protein